MITPVPEQPDVSYEVRLAELDQRINNNLQDTEAFFERAKLFLSLKRYEEARNDADAALALRRKWVEAWVLRAEIFAFLKDYDSAFVNYDVALKLDLKRASTYWSRARLYEYFALASHRGKTEPAFREKNGRAALADYAMALKLDSGNRSYIRARAHLCKELGEYQQALSDYNHWLQIDPDNLAARLDRAEVCMRLGLNQEALAEYNYLLDHQPGPTLYEKRGLLYKALGEFQLALKDLRYALELSANLPRQALAIRQIRADIFQQMGQKQRTLEELSQILPLEEQLFGSSEVTQARIKRLEQELAQGNLSGLGADCLPPVPADRHPATLQASSQVYSDPHNPACFYRRGLIYFDLQAYTKALADFDYALSLNPDYEWAKFGRGRVYAARGQTERARDEWRTLRYNTETGSLRNAVEKELARIGNG
jgi:tetratricopeptide (TPR) repeat protein